MKSFLRAALVVAACLSILGIFTALVWFANAWVVSFLVTATVIVWLAGWLVILYAGGRLRAAGIGTLAAATTYWLLALGPWFHVNIGSTLLTSRLLSWIEVNYRQPVQQVVVNPTYTTSTLDLGSNGLVTQNTIISGGGMVTAPRYIVTTAPSLLPTAPPGRSPFALVGHWSFVWIFGLASGALAVLLQRRAACPLVDLKQGDV